jgi:hypothetical protein
LRRPAPRLDDPRLERLVAAGTLTPATVQAPPAPPGDGLPLARLLALSSRQKAKYSPGIDVMQLASFLDRPTASAAIRAYRDALADG